MSKSNEVIVLVHGLIRSHKSMSRLGNYLSKKGYDVYLYHYPSTKYLINEHGLQFKYFVENLLQENPDKKFHFITHSLGGIIAREALSKISQQQLNKCGCLIMLAPPNQGSSLAKLCVKLIPFISTFIKPLAELSSKPDAYVHQIETPDKIKIGVIAGRFDAKTPPRVTYLSSQKDFLIINSTHTFIMNHPKARKAIITFLQKGIFHETSIHRKTG